MKFIIAAFIIVIIATMFTLPWIMASTDPQPLDTLPNNVSIIQRSIEVQGFGHSEYYAFDENGTRYWITQELFDSLKDTPRV